MSSNKIFWTPTTSDVSMIDQNIIDSAVESAITINAKTITVSGDIEVPCRFQFQLSQDYAFGDVSNMTFDGRNNTITIKNTPNYQRRVRGLFKLGHISSAKVTNFTLRNLTLNADSNLLIDDYDDSFLFGSGLFSAGGNYSQRIIGETNTDGTPATYYRFENILYDISNNIANINNTGGATGSFIQQQFRYSSNIDVTFSNIAVLNPCADRSGLVGGGCFLNNSNTNVNMSNIYVNTLDVSARQLVIANSFGQSSSNCTYTIDSLYAVGYSKNSCFFGNRLCETSSNTTFNMSNCYALNDNPAFSNNTLPSLFQDKPFYGAHNANRTLEEYGNTINISNVYTPSVFDISSHEDYLSGQNTHGDSNVYDLSNGSIGNLNIDNYTAISGEYPLLTSLVNSYTLYETYNDRIFTLNAPLQDIEESSDAPAPSPAPAEIPEYNTDPPTNTSSQTPPTNTTQVTGDPYIISGKNIIKMPSIDATYQLFNYSDNRYKFIINASTQNIENKKEYVLQLSTYLEETRLPFTLKQQICDKAFNEDINFIRNIYIYCEVDGKRNELVLDLWTGETYPNTIEWKDTVINNTIYTNHKAKGISIAFKPNNKDNGIFKFYRSENPQIVSSIDQVISPSLKKKSKGLLVNTKWDHCIIKNLKDHYSVPGYHIFKKEKISESFISPYGKVTTRDIFRYHKMKKEIDIL